MKSVNFEILRTKWPELADLGGFAEVYTNSDPTSALVKMRSFIEVMVKHLYNRLNLPLPPYAPNIYELLEEASFRSKVHKVVLDKFHTIRIAGNKAAHDNLGSRNKALAILRETHDLARWFYVFLGGGTKEDCTAFVVPQAGEVENATKTQLKREKKAALQKIAAQEAQLSELLAQVEERQTKAEQAEQKIEELQQLIADGAAAANELEFDEETTRRRLIDTQLVAAGWDVAPNGGNTSQVTQEEEIKHQPTSSGIGFADYVLWGDDHKPLGVIEAKKASIESEMGRKQAEIYADGLEKEYGQRPVIFYTNGYDVHIWDDAQKYPPRPLYGFYSKASLEYLVEYQRRAKKDLESARPDITIIDRLYQTQAVKQVAERFNGRHRKALIVQATGTGKTRVAIGLTKMLVQNGWAKRILFLCDRRELRRQAKNAFTAHMGDEPLTVVTATTAKDRTKRIYLATYPAIKKVFQTFDVGFFDLIIADESHRSIYNRYREIFKYFDALQVGLTATPIDLVHRNTFTLFGCEEGSPTAYYSYDQAVSEGYLVPLEVFSHTTNFLRNGIKYADLTDEQKEQLEADGEDPETFNHESQAIDKQVFNKETNRAIIKNLMINGIREATGHRPGKTIVFARNHTHADLLRQMFDELFPQFEGKFCRAIDYYDPRADQLIDDFKDPDHELTIAVSVDMLDTGIDVPEVVNLVFAKPVKSKVKFEQMIGRGTRLCPDLFGPGQDKTVFRIFDHWGNFEYFDRQVKEAETKPTKSLMQQVFEARIDLVETALEKLVIEAFYQTIELIGSDLNALPEESIHVRERWRDKRMVSRPEVLKQFAPATVNLLRHDMANLMQWVNTRGQTAAMLWDLLITKIQIEFLRQSSLLNGLKDEARYRVSLLPINLNQVAEKIDTIHEFQSDNFWDSMTVIDLERMRLELRGLMRHLPKGGMIRFDPKFIDITDGGEEYREYKPNMPANEMKLYEKRVESVLKELFDANPVLQKIRAGQSVTDSDLSSLTSLVLTQHPDIDLNVLKEFYGESAGPLDYIIRTIVGMDGEAVNEHFIQFTKKYPLTARQNHFLRLLKNHIQKHGAIEIETLYQAPFTSLDSQGLDGVFSDDSQIDELIDIIEFFSPEHIREHTAQ